MTRHLRPGSYLLDGLRWEYEMNTVDVTTIEDPPDSVPPLMVYRRRPIGDWEFWEPTPGEIAPVWVEPTEPTDAD